MRGFVRPFASAVIGSLAAAWVFLAAAQAASPGAANEGAEQNVHASQQYEKLLCTNPGFRAKRIAQECGPIDDPQMHQSCVDSFQCNATKPGSQKAPPSETIK